MQKRGGTYEEKELVELYIEQSLCACHSDDYILHPGDFNPVYPVFQGRGTFMGDGGTHGIYGKLHSCILVLGGAALPEDTDEDAAYPGRLYFAGQQPF